MSLPIEQDPELVRRYGTVPTGKIQRISCGEKRKTPKRIHSQDFAVRMPWVQVSDETGKPLTKVKVADTKLQALQRLGIRAGILSDKDGFALLDESLYRCLRMEATTTEYSRGKCLESGSGSCR